MTKTVHVETDYGELKLVERIDASNGLPYCECYSGRNFDVYIGDIECSIDADPIEIADEINYMM